MTYLSISSLQKTEKQNRTIESFDLDFFNHLYRIVAVRRSVFHLTINKRSVLIFQVVHDDTKLQTKITPKKHIH